MGALRIIMIMLNIMINDDNDEDIDETVDDDNNYICLLLHFFWTK